MEAMVRKSKSIQKLAEALQDADAVVVGAGAGLSASAGFDYSGQRFTRWCEPWEKKYDVHDFYSAGFYPFSTLEEFWVFGVLRFLPTVTNAAWGKCTCS